eukprot:2663543-Rhodomonas_salina.5
MHLLCAVRYEVAATAVLTSGAVCYQEVDWWALGALAWEMVTGDNPFYHKNRKVTCLLAGSARHGRIWACGFVLRTAMRRHRSTEHARCTGGGYNVGAVC